MNTKLMTLVCMFFLFSITTSVKAQWLTNGTNLYYKNGNVGIGTSGPTEKLLVKGRIAVSPEGTTSHNDYYGQIAISKPYEGGQFINLVSSGRVAWSIGTIYNRSAFAISAGTNRGESQFTEPFFTIAQGGYVGIGVINTSEYKLDVKGTIRATEIRVETTGADFVFENNYELLSLDEVAFHIQENKHLPGIPSAKEMQENGIGVSELNTKLLQKIEELTLYTLQQQEEINELKSFTKDLVNKLSHLISE